MKTSPARVDVGAGFRAAAGIRRPHEVQGSIDAGPHARTVYRTHTGDLRVQPSGLTLLGIGVFADIDAAPGPGNVASLHCGTNLARVAAALE